MKIVKKVTQYEEGNNDMMYIVYLTDDNFNVINAEVGDLNKSDKRVEKLLNEYKLHPSDDVYLLPSTTDDLTTLKDKLPKKEKYEITDKQTPLILVFYLDKELMSVPEIINPYTETINTIITEKQANAIAIFLPTSDNERVECINPQVINKDTQNRVDKLIADIEVNFNINKDDKGEDFIKIVDEV